MMTAWRLKNSKERRKGREEEGGECGKRAKSQTGTLSISGRERRAHPPTLALSHSYLSLVQEDSGS